MDASEAEEEWLQVALFATQCVEEAGLSFDRYTDLTEQSKTEKKKKKKKKKKEGKVCSDKQQRKQQPERAATTQVHAAVRYERDTRSSDKDKQLMVAPSNKRKIGLWSADTGLTMWNNLANLIKHFERHLWVIVPLRPSVLHEDSIRLALLGQPSERAIEDSPLLFNVNVAMACGTYMHTHPTTTSLVCVEHYSSISPWEQHRSW